jgi:hypothetical protein
VARAVVIVHAGGFRAPAPSADAHSAPPSADSRQHGSGIYHVLAYLQHLSLSGVRVINGAKAFGYEISKAAQASLLRSLGLPGIPTRVIHDPSQALAAAAQGRHALRHAGRPR